MLGGVETSLVSAYDWYKSAWFLSAKQCQPDEKIEVQGIRQKDSPSVRDASDNVDKYVI